MISWRDTGPASYIIDWHRANICSNNNVMPITEKMKDGMQLLSFREIPSFDFSELIASLSWLMVVAGYCVMTSYCFIPGQRRDSS